MRLSLMITALFLSAGVVSAQQDDDILQLKGKDGELKFLRGKVIKITEDIVEFRDKKLGKLTIPVDSIYPASLYKVKVRRIKKGDAKAHFELGRWCTQNYLYSMAEKQFQEAKSLDAKLTVDCNKQIKIAREEDARTMLEQARIDILKKKYETAAKTLGKIMMHYDDTPYAEKAKEESAKLAETIRLDMEAKKKKDADKKKEEAAKKDGEKLKGEKRVLNDVITGLELAKKQWSEALGWEARDNITQFRKAMSAAEANLDRAELRLKPLLKSDSVETIKIAKELDKELDHWQVQVYWRFGRNYAEHLTYSDAIKYLNKALVTPHDSFMDRMVNELLLTLTQLRMRKRAAGGGYK